MQQAMFVHIGTLRGWILRALPFYLLLPTSCISYVLSVPQSPQSSLFISAVAYRFSWSPWVHLAQNDRGLSA